ncbi:MOSC domain-containing protein [Citreimonas sp.]|uniref:MOSC domain-containing protein n=1 Tax=Citreimonas sp. TaxID=3036715 RepID=UPI0035C80FF0
MQTIADLQSRFFRPGRVVWIGVRSARKAPMHGVQRVEIDETGLVGDHGQSAQRAVTLLQAEHLAVIEALCGKDIVVPELLRRNVLVAGINLNALRNRPIWLGTARLEITGPCAPCSRMEAALGEGGYSAMRGHGGWCARVIEPGIAAIGDQLVPAAAERPLGQADQAATHARDASVSVFRNPRARR